MTIAKPEPGWGARSTSARRKKNRGRGEGRQGGGDDGCGVGGGLHGEDDGRDPSHVIFVLFSFGSCQLKALHSFNAFITLETLPFFHGDKIMSSLLSIEMKFILRFTSKQNALCILRTNQEHQPKRLGGSKQKQ